MSDTQFDPAIGAWLQEGPERGPQHGLERALAATRRVSQRPGWVFPRRWLPGPLADWQPRVPAVVMVGLLLVLMLLVVFALGIALGGLPRHINSPFGAAGDRLVAYQEGDAVYVSRIDSRDERRISADVPYARSPLFSPDGKLVAFVAPQAPGELGGRLMVVPVDGPLRAVAVSGDVDVLATNVSSLSWAPDSTHIAFAGTAGGKSRIYVAAADGSKSNAITDDLADRDLPTWSPVSEGWHTELPPPGDWIFFREKDPDGIRTRLREVRADGSEFAEVMLVVAPDAYLSRARLETVHGRLSYWWSPGFGAEESARIDKGFTHGGDAWTTGAGGFIDNGAPWSPDAAQLVLLTGTDGVVLAENHTSLVDTFDGHLRRLGDVADCWVDWIPDGSGIYGGSPGDCSQTVLIPLSQPNSPWYLPGSASGTASWQPLAN
jgi:hypothetical protein